MENVYETVDEKEYTKRVMDLCDEDWIVDDGIINITLIYLV